MCVFVHVVVTRVLKESVNEVGPYVRGGGGVSGGGSGMNASAVSGRARGVSDSGGKSSGSSLSGSVCGFKW